MAKEQNKAVILARVSSKEQSNEGYSIPAQVKLLEDYCIRNDLNVVRKPFEIAESASGKKQRFLFDSMQDYIKKNNINNLVVEKVDRLTRNFKDAVMIDDWLEEDETRKLHLVKDSLVMHKNSRSQEKLNWGIRIIFAKNYIDNLREETEKGQMEKIAQGWSPASPPPGYITIGETGHRTHILDSNVSPLIRRLFELYDTGEYSVTTLKDAIDELGLKRKGKCYSRAQIHQILKNQFYIGRIKWKGQIYPGNHPQIVSEELFNRVQARLRGSKGKAKYDKHNPLFKGLIHCEECSSLITWQIQKGHWYGHCHNKNGCTQNYYIREEVLESQLIDALGGLASPSSEIIDWVKRALREKHESDIMRDHNLRGALNSERTALNRRLDILYEDRLDERISIDQYDEMTAKIKLELGDVATRLDRLDNLHSSSIDEAIELFDYSQKVSNMYETQSLKNKRQILRSIFSNLSVANKKIDYDYSDLAKIVFNGRKSEQSIIEKFELANNADNKAKKHLEGAIYQNWLGVLDEVRTNYLVTLAK